MRLILLLLIFPCCLLLILFHSIFLHFCLLSCFFEFRQANLLLTLPLAALTILGPISELNTILSLSRLTSAPKIEHLSFLLPYFEFEAAVKFRELRMTQFLLDDSLVPDPADLQFHLLNCLETAQILDVEGGN